MIGGAGNDTYFVDNAGDAVIENADEGTDTVFATDHTSRWRRTWRTWCCRAAADLQGYGNALANAIYGNTGNNLLDGGAGADAMIGGAGNDTYFVDNAGDAVIENADEGTDTVFASRQLRAGGERGDPGAARRRRPAGLRQRPGQRDLRQQRQQPRSTATSAPTPWSAAPATTPTSSTMPATP